MSDYDPDDLKATADMDDVRGWLETIADAIEEGAYEPSSWEVDFLESVASRLDEAVDEVGIYAGQPLSGKQLARLRGLVDKVEE